MKVSEIYQSKYLKSDDIPDEDVNVTITDEAIEPVGPDKDEKLVIRFRELPKPWVCNKTCADVIASIHGGDTDDWTGKKITLYKDEVTFQGKTTLAIRVRLRPPVSQKRTEQQINDEEPTVPAPEYNEIPF